MDNLQHFRRTDYCGTFTAANVARRSRSAAGYSVSGTWAA